MVREFRSVLKTEQIAVNHIPVHVSISLVKIRRFMASCSLTSYRKWKEQ